MKFIIRLLGIITATLLFGILMLNIFDYGYILRGVKITYLNGYKTVYIDDYIEFDNRIIKAGNNPQPWPKHVGYNTTEMPDKLQKTHFDLETTAFLIIKNDSLWFEHYYNDYGPDSRTNSFSIAKSIMSALLVKAIMEGSVESLSQPVSDFFPQFDPSLKVEDLSSMSSGLNWDESVYNPFSMTARAYFDKNIRELILNLKVSEEPGKEFKYLSGNTQLLALVLEKATGKLPSAYLSQNFWKPMGMENDALWQLDSKKSGTEKAYCCIASNAKDFARFGKLYKNYGKWNNKQILDSVYVAKSIRPRFEESPQYGYGFWLSDHKNKDIFYMRGVLGQYVIVIPEDDLIIVRLGKKLIKKEEKEEHAPDFFLYIDETYKMLQNASQT